MVTVDIVSKAEIVNTTKLDKIIKRHQYEELTYIKDDLVLIRPSIIENLRGQEEEIEGLDGFSFEFGT